EHLSWRRHSLGKSTLRQPSHATTKCGRELHDTLRKGDLPGELSKLHLSWRTRLPTPTTQRFSSSIASHCGCRTSCTPAAISRREPEDFWRRWKPAQLTSCWSRMRLGWAPCL